MSEQWRKPCPQFGGGGRKNILPSPQIQKFGGDVPPNSTIWGDGEKLTVSWN